MNAHKIVDSLLTVALIVVSVIGYWAVTREKQNTQKLLTVDLPMEQSVREVEVSIWETANAAFYYATLPSATSRAEYKKQLNDVDTFIGIYKNLIETDQERQAVEHFEKDWAGSVALAEEVFRLRNQMTQLQEQAWEAAYEASELINYNIQFSIESQIPRLPDKQRAIRQIELGMWQAINAMNYYTYSQSDITKNQLQNSLTNVEDFWKKYVELASGENKFIEQFDTQWKTIAQKIRDCAELTDKLRTQYITFSDSVHAVDDILDFDIQEKLLKTRLSTFE